jgi:predicted lipase
MHMCKDANCETETKIRRQTYMADENELQNSERENIMNTKNGQPETEKEQNQKLLRLMTGSVESTWSYMSIASLLLHGR